ncbi:hypothetical protein L2D14_01435 [Thalassospiraceae bacterium LMO-JJ14]|nr:hypothetical protein L2D14_01435 [Thalassospiraceae bacterium LMO-JJ14]
MSDYKLTIYADKSDEFGHFSVGVTGPGIDEPIIGKHLRDKTIAGKVGAVIGGAPGVVRDDSERKGKSTVIERSIPMTKEQAQKAAEYIANARANPGEYELFGKNCVELAQGALDASGADARIDKMFTEQELDEMGDFGYGAGDLAQRRGHLRDMEKIISQTKPGAERRKAIREYWKRGGELVPDDVEKPRAEPDEVSKAPVGVGLGAEAARNAAEDAETNAPQTDDGDATSDSVPESARAKAMAIVASGKNGRGTDQGTDQGTDLGAGGFESDLDDLMLKPVDDLTEDEAKALGQWSWKLKSNDPRRLEIENLRRGFYVLNYGDKPVDNDATGRMIAPEPVRKMPEKPKALASPNGEPVADALQRFAARIAKPVHDDGETNVVKALQSGLSMFGDVLKVDGVSGPKTKAALKRTVARHGAGRAEEAFGIGRFRNFAETERNTGGSASGLKRTVEKEVQPLFGAGKPKVAAETLQESLNDLGAKAAQERNKPAPEPLKVDGDIGPKTTDAFRSALAENGPEKLTKSYTSMLGFSD